MGKTGKIIITVFVSAVVLFAGMMGYAVWDYCHRCVDITVKEEISYIDEGESYAVEDLFNVYRADEDCRFNMTVTWVDGSTDGIVVADDQRSFTVTEGEGALLIGVSAMNSDSPEGNQVNRIVEVVGEN